MRKQIKGVIKKTGNRFEVRHWERSFRRDAKPVFLRSGLGQRFGLIEGASIEGEANEKKRELEVCFINKICGLDPRDFKKRPQWDDLVAIAPTKRFHLDASGEVGMRIIDLIAPVGKGTRGLIVSPPKAGKTTILKNMANAIRTDDKDTRVIVLLIDERPEEVTYFKRDVDAEVVASSIDQSVDEHIELAEIMLDHVRVELECGRDIVVLVDSITRMGRAFNKRERSRRTLSGGLGARAMEIPRKFFGLARNIEGGGSVTIIGTCLVDTGSRMDKLIFEEFKGTGNSELVLDRRLAERRIFPAINIAASGTRMEERLFGAEDARRVGMIRKVLAGGRDQEMLESLREQIGKFENNAAFLRSIPVQV